MNQLTIHKDDENRLLKTKNILDESVLDKYRTAGHIVETALKYTIDIINEMYHFQSQPVKPISQICLIVDSLMAKMLQRVYVKCENNISTPTSFNINEIISNYSPESDDLMTFNQGDVITISLGVSVDGYVAETSHTIVIYPPGEKPVGPLLGAKSDAIVANYYIKQVVTSLLGLSLSPEKLPVEIQNEFGKQISGKLLKSVVESIAEAFNCRVVPGSEIRVIRRFLSGQNDFLQEKGYKGYKWGENDQETFILNKLGVETTDEIIDFTVVPGEVYKVDITVASIEEFEDLGIITTEELNKYTGLNNKTDEMKIQPQIYVRDFIINYQLKLKTSRSLLGKIDKLYSVYPFKLSYLSDNFPLNGTGESEIETVTTSYNESKFGLSEIVNHNLINYKPIKIMKYLPIKKILNENSTRFSEINSLKLIKHESLVKNKSTQGFTIIINNVSNEIIQLTGGNFKPVYCTSNYKLDNGLIDQLIKLLGDKFGVKTKKVKPSFVKNDFETVEMETD